jgi:dihydropyrimidine dehydrogenase (NAD+) subunit PreT
MSAALPSERAESVFEDYKEPFTMVQAVAEANRCLYCADAPCIQACPTGIEIPEFIRKIGTGNIKGSARTIFEANILGMSCARVCPVEVLCVGDCVYNEMDSPPIQIGKLQRYATDIAFAEGWQFFEAGPDTGKSVACIGAGPASLACAHMLRRYGHRVTIYEKNPIAGGLNTTGVAPYKMRADRSLDEVKWILGIGGIDIVSGKAVGKDISWDEIEKKHQAVFIGMGLGADSVLGVPGEGQKGIHGAVEFIEQMKLGKVDTTNVHRAAVIGGGNTAIDAVRELAGLGIEEVMLVYRGTEPTMSGYAHEWEVAKTDGVRPLWRTLPIEFGGDGTVRSIRVVRVDENKRPIAGTESDVPADLVLLAIGQAKLGDLVKGLEGIDVERGRIVVDASGATGRRGFYAGGDCANGGKEVVNAAAEGKAAAVSIEMFLNGATKAPVMGHGVLNG